MKRALVLLTLALSLFAADPKKAGMDADRLALIPVRMKALAEEGQIAGAVTLVARRGVVAELDAVGYQDLESKKPMRTDTIFQIMSMTKPITAAGILMLMDEGRLALLDPVEKYLPEFRGQWVIEKREDRTLTLRRPARPITIRDLLTHTAGVATPEAIDNIMVTMDRSLADTVLLVSQAPLQFEPGSKWAYSNSGIAVLGRIIEVVSGTPYEQFMEKRILAPLGMKDSFFFPPAEKTGRISMIYGEEKGKLKRAGADILGGAPENFRKGAKYPCPECGMFSTASDLFAFYQMMLNGGTYEGKRLLSKASVDLMTTVHTGDLPAGFEPGLGWGLGWGVVRDPMGTVSLRSLGTYGHGGAFGTEGWIDPKTGVIRILLIGRTNPKSDARLQFYALAGAAVVE